MTISDWRIELIILPVTDVDRAKAFYVDSARLERRLRPARLPHPAVRAGDASRFRVLDRVRRGPHRHDARHDEGPADRRPERGRGARAPRRERRRGHAGSNDLAWGRFVDFTDPDGNAWTLQELPKREAN